MKIYLKSNKDSNRSLSLRVDTASVLMTSGADLSPVTFDTALTKKNYSKL